MMQANSLLEPLEGVDPEISCFWAQMALTSLFAISGPKKVLISGPTTSNGPRHGYCLHQNYYVPRHINNRYIKNINSYSCTVYFWCVYSMIHLVWTIEGQIRTHYAVMLKEVHLEFNFGCDVAECMVSASRAAVRWSQVRIHGGSCYLIERRRWR
jgi:hypothetical protein